MKKEKGFSMCADCPFFLRVMNTVTRRYGYYCKKCKLAEEKYQKISDISEIARWCPIKRR